MAIDIEQLKLNLDKLTSDNDMEVLNAIKQIRAAFRGEGAGFKASVIFAAQALNHWQGELGGGGGAASDDAPSSLPDCRPVNDGGQPAIEIIGPGQVKGKVWAIPGDAQGSIPEISEQLKDAFVVAMINTTKMKLKLNDIKNDKGEIIETILQSEYARSELQPVKIWSGPRGEAAMLASVLRKAMQFTLPDISA